MRTTLAAILFYLWLLGSLCAGAVCRGEGVSILDLDPTCTPSATEDRTEQIAAALASKAAIGRRVTFPAGTYLVSGTIAKLIPGTKLALAGEGIGLTRFLAASDFTDPLIAIDGISYATIDDINFDGGGHSVTWIDAKNAAHLDFMRCRWGNYKGCAVRGYKLWDSTFSRCRIDTADLGIDLLPPDNPANAAEAVANCCNNVVADTCSFEQVIRVLRSGLWSRKNRIVNCKIERCGDTTNRDKKLWIPALEFDPSQPNIVLGSQFTWCKLPVQKPQGELVFQANVIDPKP